MKSYGQMIREALDEVLNNDPTTLIIGEDIGIYGGAFGITKGLLEKYGPHRVVDSPMSEQAIVGFGIGAALNGLKPIVEIMFMDFMTLCYDQLFNHACIFNYLSNGRLPVPLVIRVAAGAGRGYGATHSKSLYAPLMHIPCIKIVAPSSPENVKGLLKASVQDKNPVIFVEHKLLYGVKGNVDMAQDYIPLGKAKIARKGDDVLIISYSKMVNDCLQVADKLDKEGISVEVIDLRTVKPIDIKLIKSSVEKIGRVVIVDEGYGECGVASEIVAKINEHCFYSLDAPIRRVCSLDVPIPCCPSFEKEVIPSCEKIESAVRGMVNE